MVGENADIIKPTPDNSPPNIMRILASIRLGIKLANKPLNKIMH